jgi:hypothetical protein
MDTRLEPILSPTYGVMVYQEQVMKIAQEIGGYTLGGADLLRRAMGKKKPEEMAKHRGIFVEGAVKNSVPRRRRRSSSTSWRSSRATASTSRTRRVRARRLPDRVLQGASSVRVHGREPVARHGRHRQGAQPARDASDSG